jgi:hypothetical protein
MVFKTLLLIMVISVLMEDSLSIRKTAEEVKEDEEVARAVNETLAEEEKRRKEDEERKRTEDETRGRKKDRDEKKDPESREPEEERKDKGEALPCFNLTCPAVKPCPKEKEEEVCPEEKTCPPVECGPCPGVNPCRPCSPCPVANSTVEPPSTPGCPEASMTVPVAMAIGAIASLLIAGVATMVGLVLRYVPPLISGSMFLITVLLVGFLSSRYPETARELGGRVVATLREATIALGHRVMEAIRHQEQVGFFFFPNKPSFLFRMSSRFEKSLKKFALRFSI